jgi:hypothetical protein
MTAALREAVAGAPAASLGAAPAELHASQDPGAAVGEEIDALGRASARASREAEADRLLAELKKKMGK